MRETGANLGIPVFVFGPETHMTAVVGMALGKRAIPKDPVVEFSTANFLLPGGQSGEVYPSHLLPLLPTTFPFCNLAIDRYRFAKIKFDIILFV